MLPPRSIPLFRYSPRWIRQKPEHTRIWLHSLFRDPVLRKVNADQQGKDRLAGGGGASRKLVILGHPVKPKHLRNAARFTFRTEFMRFRKGAYKRHSTLQTILKAFWPEPITLKASNFFSQPTPPTHLLVTEQRYSRHFSPNKLNPLFLEGGGSRGWGHHTFKKDVKK